MKKLPNIITCCVLIISLLACYILLRDQLLLAFALISMAMAGDGVDGYLARRMQVVSNLGTALDSIGDVFIYILFPAIFWIRHFFLPWPVILILSVAGIWRLIRFSLEGHITDGAKLYYAGVPVYFIQFLILLSIYFNPSAILLSLAILILSILMIMKFRFPKLGLNVLMSFLALYFISSLIIFSR